MDGRWGDKYLPEFVVFAWPPPAHFTERYVMFPHNLLWKFTGWPNWQGLTTLPFWPTCLDKSVQACPYKRARPSHKRSRPRWNVICPSIQLLHSLNRLKTALIQTVHSTGSESLLNKIILTHLKQGFFLRQIYR